MDGLSRNDQRRIAKGKIVHIPTHRPLFDAQGTTAETLMVTLTALQRTVEEHNQRRTITHDKFPSQPLRISRTIKVAHHLPVQT
jgi:hypothetical protein